MKILTRKQAIEQGYTIDDRATGGPIGYMGPSARRWDIVSVMTEREEELVEALRECHGRLELLVDRGRGKMLDAVAKQKAESLLEKYDA